MSAYFIRNTTIEYQKWDIGSKYVIMEKISRIIIILNLRKGLTRRNFAVHWLKWDIGSN